MITLSVWELLTYIILAVAALAHFLQWGATGKDWTEMHIFIAIPWIAALVLLYALKWILT